MQTSDDEAAKEVREMGQRYLPSILLLELETR